MITVALSGAPAIAAPAATLTDAIGHYQTVESYRVTIRASHSGNQEHFVYYYKKPGFVRMEFITPHAGAVLIYNPDTKRVRLWPFGFGHFPELNLSPANPLIRASGGQHVDHSDVGVLFEDMRTLQQSGETRVLGEEVMDGRPVVHLVTTGGGTFTVAGVHRYELWLDTATRFPAKIISKDTHDAILETVIMDQLEINKLPDTLFNP